MKRIGLLFGSALLAALVTGCDSGLKEGPPDEVPINAQPPGFAEQMKKQGEKMNLKTKPKYIGTTAPSDAAKPAP